MRRYGRMKPRVTLVWTQWFLGIWWWPVPKDLALGVCLGPLQLQLVRRSFDE